MHKPNHVIEIFLQPGDFYFGDRDTRIRTILGSCVSITIWHPRLLIGGMCHYMLPTRRRCGGEGELDGRYADEAMEMFMREIRLSKTKPFEYQVKIFGGGDMFPETKKRHISVCSRQTCSDPLNTDCGSVGCRNINTAQLLVKKNGFDIHASCLGGEGHRQVFFDVWTGHVWNKRNLAKTTR